MVPKEPTSWAGRIEGFVAGATSALAFVALVDWSVFDQLGVYGPAALGGTFTIIAAYIALKGVTSQIAISKESERQRTKNLRRARRAAIAVPLSRLSRLCEGRRDFWSDELWKKRSVLGHRVGEALPGSFGEKDVQVFIDLIEICEPQPAFYLSKIIQDFQVLSSRDQGLYDCQVSVTADRAFIQRIAEWHVFRFFVNRVFDYQRGNYEFIEIPNFDVDIGNFDMDKIINRNGGRDIFEIILKAEFCGSVSEYTYLN